MWSIKGARHQGRWHCTLEHSTWQKLPALDTHPDLGPNQHLQMWPGIPTHARAGLSNPAVPAWTGNCDLWPLLKCSAPLSRGTGAARDAERRRGRRPFGNGTPSAGGDLTLDFATGLQPAVHGVDISRTGWYTCSGTRACTIPRSTVPGLSFWRQVRAITTGFAGAIVAARARAQRRGQHRNSAHSILAQIVCQYPQALEGRCLPERRDGDGFEATAQS